MMIDKYIIDILYLDINKWDCLDKTPLENLADRISRFLNKYNTGWSVSRVKDSQFSNSNGIALVNSEGQEEFLKIFNSAQVLAIVPNKSKDSSFKNKLEILTLTANINLHKISEKESVSEIDNTEDVFEIKIPFKKTILNFKNND